MRLDIAGYDDSRGDVEDETMMPGKRLASTTMTPELTGTNHHTRSISILFLQRRLGVFSIGEHTAWDSPMAVQTPFFLFLLFVRRRKTGPVLGSSAGYEQTLIWAWTGIVIPTTTTTT
jgi:hypothetical protein